MEQGNVSTSMPLSMVSALCLVRENVRPYEACAGAQQFVVLSRFGPVDKVIIPEQIPANMTHRKAEKAERRRP